MSHSTSQEDLFCDDGHQFFGVEGDPCPVCIQASMGLNDFKMVVLRQLDDSATKTPRAGRSGLADSDRTSY